MLERRGGRQYRHQRGAEHIEVADLGRVFWANQEHWKLGECNHGEEAGLRVGFDGVSWVGYSGDRVISGI